MKAVLLATALGILSAQAMASEHVPGNCSPSHPVHRKCRNLSFTSDKGAQVSATIYVYDTRRRANEPQNSVLGIEFRYRDTQNFFEGAPVLYPYVGALKHRLLATGESIDATVHLQTEMRKDRLGDYRGDLSIDLVGEPRISHEVVDKIAFAFTDQSPHSGEAKWDSDGHRNYNVLVDLAQGSYCDGLRCADFNDSIEACNAMPGCAFDRGIHTCVGGPRCEE